MEQRLHRLGMRLEVPLTRLREAAGFTLLIAGLIGMLLPVIPGIPMLAAGAALLGRNHASLKLWVARLGRWHSLLRRTKP